MAKQKDAAPVEPTPAPAAGEPVAAPAEPTPAPAPAAAAAPKAGAAVTPDAPKKKKKPGVAPRRGKKLRSHMRNIEKKVADAGTPNLKQAVSLLKQVKRAKFDETVELHINLGIDASQSDQMVRGTVSLPHGIGKSVRVAVFCQGEKIAAAKAAGADVAGGPELVDKVQKENFLDFDVAITTQDMMPQVAKLGKVLGPRGLMPTPKAGTVVPANADIATVVKEFKAGKVEYRADKTGQVHCGVGKMSFSEDKLVENITTLMDAVRAAKPSGVKGNYINGVVLSATMSPGIRVSL
jgi:large subunit ribosomal protein L1